MYVLLRSSSAVQKSLTDVFLKALLEYSFLYKDLLQAYPDAKVILTTRSVDSWISSARETLFPIASWDWSSVVTVDPHFAAPWWEYVQLVMHLILGDSWQPFDAAKGGDGKVTAEAEHVARERYEKHYADVRALVPKEKLLEWHPSEGWKPLCEFLGVQAPFVKDFPRVNDKEEFVAFHRGWFEQLKAKKAELDGLDGHVKVAKRCDTID